MFSPKRFFNHQKNIFNKTHVFNKNHVFTKKNIFSPKNMVSPKNIVSPKNMVSHNLKKKLLSQDFLRTFSRHLEFGTDCLGLAVYVFSSQLKDSLPRLTRQRGNSCLPAGKTTASPSASSSPALPPAPPSSSPCTGRGASSCPPSCGTPHPPPPWSTAPPVCGGRRPRPAPLPSSAQLLIPSTPRRRQSLESSRQTSSSSMSSIHSTGRLSI